MSLNLFNMVNGLYPVVTDVEPQAAGLLFVEALQCYIPGAKNLQVYLPGPRALQIYIPGMKAGQVTP